MLRKNWLSWVQALRFRPQWPATVCWRIYHASWPGESSTGLGAEEWELLDLFRRQVDDSVFFFVLFWVKLLQGKHQYPELTVKIGILKPNCTFNPRFSFCYLCCRLSTLQYRMITEAQIRQHVMFKSARTMWRSARSKWSLDHWREGCKGQGYQRWTWMLRREKSMVKNHSCRGHTFRYLRKIDMIQKIPTWYC